MKKLNYYDGEMFIDMVEGNKIIHRHFIKDAHYIIVAHSLNECLHVLLDKCHTLFGYDIMIGISSIWCNDKHIDWNYKNRVIYKDDELKEYMWC